MNAFHWELIGLVSLFRYRVQSPSSGGEEEEQGATEPERAAGRGGRAGVSVSSPL